jgi:hypothetical protein
VGYDCREWVCAWKFMEALLPPDGCNHCHLLHGHKAPFGATFNNAKTWFRKIDQGEMIHVSHLWRYITFWLPRHRRRDTGLFHGNALSHAVMLIHIHIKSDKCHLTGRAFSSEYSTPGFSDGNEPLPVIGMVFVLGSDESGITFPAQEYSNIVRHLVWDCVIVRISDPVGAV